MTAPAFRYIDLFAGIGGFHAVLDAMGGECVYAVEIDPAARAVYEANWGTSAKGRNAVGDITLDADEGVMAVPTHDVLVAGFPCQPFSKSGAQRGMDEARGTLFFNIMEIIQARQPAVVLLENVRNLAGPRHVHEWDVIIRSLREAGYRVSQTPAIFSPALIAPEHGGHPQTRDRVFIAATRITDGSDPEQVIDPIRLDPSILMPTEREWSLATHLPLDDAEDVPGTGVSQVEWTWIDAWDEWVQHTREMLTVQAERDGRKAAPLPGHPIWAHAWTTDEGQREKLRSEAKDMAWKQTFYKKNWDLYKDLIAFDPDWVASWLDKVHTFPESRQKFEWQAQTATRVRHCVISLRPSGLRVKRMTHLPALVAITQTPILGPLSRRLSVTEAARLQGLPDNFTFAGQRDAATFKQLGNGVNTGVVAQVLLAQITRDADLLQIDPRGRRIHQAVTTTMSRSGGDLREEIQAAVARGQQRATLASAS